jgi:predicted GNAT superfamily acetyltransferase
MIIRPLDNLAEIRKCVELQREVWGLQDIDLMPVRNLLVQTKIGGIVLGAFDGDRLAGYASATPGVRNGVPFWYSQMLAVRKEYRNSGLGADLKLAQRGHALQQGIHLIEWSYDPLESKNAYLNVKKLGAIVRKYYVNLYGTTTSQLQAGLESDRVIAEWWIDKPRINVQDAGQGNVRRLYIPADIQALKKQSLKSAQDVQLRVRGQFLKNIEDDYYVAGFERTDEWSEYLFVPGASRVYQTD